MKEALGAFSLIISTHLLHFSVMYLLQVHKKGGLWCIV